MAKAVLISIRTGWIELIACGDKTIEIRKSYPKFETPFKCYIYCTKEKDAADRLWVLPEEERSKYFGLTCIVADLGNEKDYALGNRKVVGEFVCDRITDITLESMPHPELDGDWTEYRYEWEEEDLEFKSCLTYKQIEEYLNRKNGYAWHISGLKIYNSPKVLTEFHTLKKCKSCSRSGYESTGCT